MSSGSRWHFRVHHLLEAIEKIQRYISGLDQSAFAGDDKTLDAVVRNFQVIGEAARRVPDHVRQAHPEIPWSEMQKMRHVLVHDYDRIDAAIVWATIRKDLPPLLDPLHALLNEPDQ